MSCIAAMSRLLPIDSAVEPFAFLVSFQLRPASLTRIWNLGTERRRSLVRVRFDPNP